MSTHIVTQIKKQVEAARQKQYQMTKQKRELKYFSLYIKSIVKIQRYFRKYLVRKTRRLQEQIEAQLIKKEFLYFEQKKLDEEIGEAKAKRDRLRNSNLKKVIEFQKQNISQNVRQIVRNVVNSADKYAKNSAISKTAMLELKKLVSQEKELKVQIKELQLEKQCYQQRIASWQQKLRQIREKIIQQASTRKQLIEELEQVN